MFTFVRRRQTTSRLPLPACSLTDVCYVMFVNTMNGVHFYVINTTVIYKFTALLSLHTSCTLTCSGSSHIVAFNSRNYSV